VKKAYISIFIIMCLIFLNTNATYPVVNGPCVNCHTMHNSQSGAPMNWDGSSTPNETLLRGGCIGCHGKGTSNNIEFGGTTPQVLHTNSTDLAGGNFAYITGAKTRETGDQNTVGHNVIDLGDTYKESTIPNNASSYPPGDEFGNYTNGLTKDTFTCAGKYGCHGDRTTVGSFAAIRGSHHVNDSVLKFGSIDEGKQGSTTALSYRFLKGVKGGEDSDWQATSSTTDHNEYKGATSRGSEGTISTPGGNTISGLCAECHGNFHGTDSGDIGTASPWLRHPTDIVLPSDTTKEYQYYNGCAGGGATCTYSLDAPVARATIPNNPSQNVNPGTEDAIVMCLSCHKVHGSANADILRWNYSTINAGGGSDNTRCFICHTTKDTGS
jgi:hypothetical protein